MPSYQFEFSGPLSGGLPFDSGYLAGFDDSFEIKNFIFYNAFENRCEQFSDACAQATGRWMVAEDDPYLRSLPRGIVKLHLPRIFYSGAIDRLPPNQSVRFVLHNLRIPFNFSPHARHFDDPM